MRILCDPDIDGAEIHIKDWHTCSDCRLCRDTMSHDGAAFHTQLPHCIDGDGSPAKV